MTEEEVKTQVLLAAPADQALRHGEEVAALALYLCERRRRSITGANLPIDGGWTAA